VSGTWWRRCSSACFPPPLFPWDDVRDRRSLNQLPNWAEAWAASAAAPPHALATGLSNLPAEEHPKKLYLTPSRGIHALGSRALLGGFAAAPVPLRLWRRRVRSRGRRRAPRSLFGSEDGGGDAGPVAELPARLSPNPVGSPAFGRDAGG